MYIILLCILCMITLPYRIGFDLPTTHSWAVLDTITEISFGMDIILNFLTAYEQVDFTLQTVHKNIAKHYVKNWFILDFLSTVPFYRFSSVNSNALQMLKFARLFRIFKVIRSLRIFKAFGVFSRHSKNFDADFIMLESIASRVFRLFCFLAFVTHLLGCCWAWASLGEDGRNWEEFIGITANHSFSTYVAAVYFAFTTMTTVGYGDIHAVSDRERICSIFLMLVGANILAYIIGVVSSHIFNRNGSTNLIDVRLGLVREYLNEQGVNENIKKNITKHVCFAMETLTPFDEIEIWNSLPHMLRSELICVARESITKEIPFFQKCSNNSVLSSLYMILEPCRCQPQSYVYTHSSRSGGVYFIVTGKANIISHSDNNKMSVEKGQKLHEVSLSSAHNGMCFGLESIFDWEDDIWGVIAETELSLMWISTENLSNLKSSKKCVYDEFICMLRHYITSPNQYTLTPTYILPKTEHTSSTTIVYNYFNQFQAFQKVFEFLSWFTEEDDHLVDDDLTSAIDKDFHANEHNDNIASQTNDCIDNSSITNTVFLASDMYKRLTEIVESSGMGYDMGIDMIDLTDPSVTYNPLVAERQRTSSVAQSEQNGIQMTNIADLETNNFPITVMNYAKNVFQDVSIKAHDVVAKHQVFS
jgi:hypothetical protein